MGCGKEAYMELNPVLRGRRPAEVAVVGGGEIAVWSDEPRL
jgi:hypothetical protein